MRRNFRKPCCGLRSTCTGGVPTHYHVTKLRDPVYPASSLHTPPFPHTHLLGIRRQLQSLLQPFHSVLCISHQPLCVDHTCHSRGDDGIVHSDRQIVVSRIWFWNHAVRRVTGECVGDQFLRLLLRLFFLLLGACGRCGILPLDCVYCVGRRTGAALLLVVVVLRH